MQLRVRSCLEYDHNLTGMVNIGSLCGGWGIFFVSIRMWKKVYVIFGAELFGRISALAPGGSWEEGTVFSRDALGPNYVTTETQSSVAEQANRRAPDYEDGISGRIRLSEEERTRSIRARTLRRFPRGAGRLRNLSFSGDLWGNVHFDWFEF